MPKDISKAKLRELCVLDTFDMFSPSYDNPQRAHTVATWASEAGLRVTHAGPMRYANQAFEVVVVKATRG